MPKKTTKKTAAKATVKASNGNGKKRTNYKAMYEELKQQHEALLRQIDDVHLMLDAVECPPNCGTLNGRMVEYARKLYGKYGSSTNPGGEAHKMLQAVEAPVIGNGPPWSLYS